MATALCAQQVIERVPLNVLGVEMEAEIFMGVVHYQRLRHMVSDKYQVPIPYQTTTASAARDPPSL